ncbi:MAG TPA: I78 family peptidase inhibitor [Sphingomicrobium sp.]|jgi:hypothetical protein
MRKLPLLLLSGVATGCATVPAEPQVRGETPGRTCSSDGAAQFVGQLASQESGTAILRATNAAKLRWAPPGVMLTMDFRADRVTVRTGPDGKITAVNCG